MNSSLRPDELSSLSEIDKSRQRDDTAKKGVKTAVGLGTAALGAGVSSKILPFLSEHIPTDLAWKGINKVAPEVGKFLKKGLSYGLDLKTGLDYIKQNIDPSSQQTSQKTPNQRSVIEQYSPELYQFLKSEIEKGRSPIEAGAIAQLQDPFKKIIKKMSDDHKAPFSSILQSVFGGNQEIQSNQNQQQPVSSLQSQQPNNDQALLSALDKILKM